MISTKFRLAIYASLIVAALTANVHAGEIQDPYGATAVEASAQRIVVLSTDTKYVNVTQGETVKFLLEGKTFTWSFNTFGVRPFALSTIAPAGFNAVGATVYLLPNPMYR